MFNRPTYWLYPNYVQWWLLCLVLLHLYKGQKTASLFWKSWFSPTQFYLPVFIKDSTSVTLLEIFSSIGGRVSQLIVFVAVLYAKYIEAEAGFLGSWWHVFWCMVYFCWYLLFLLSNKINPTPILFIIVSAFLLLVVLFADFDTDTIIINDTRDFPDL